MAIFRRDPSNGGVECKGYEKIAIVDPYRALSRRNWCKIEPWLLWKQNRKPHPSFRIIPILNDLELPLTQISRSRYYSTSNNSKRTRWYLQWRINRKSYNGLSNGAIFSDLEQWTTPNPVFKGTLYIWRWVPHKRLSYGHSYYGKRIGNCTQLLSNGTSLNDLEWPLTHISRSRYYSTSNNLDDL